MLKVLAALPHSVDRFRYFVVDRGAPHFTCAPGFVTIHTGGFAEVPLEGGGFEPLLKIVQPQYDGGTTRPLKSQVEEAQLSPDGKLVLILDDRQLYLLAVPAAGRTEPLDLVSRKLPQDDGIHWRRLFDDLQKFIRNLPQDGDLSELRRPLSAGLRWLQRATEWMVNNKDKGYIAAGATSYLRLCGMVICSFLLG